MAKPGSSERRDLATFVCSLRGHVLPAAGAKSLDGPMLLGLDVDLADPIVAGAVAVAGAGASASSPLRWRMARCLRCDSWQKVRVPADARATLPDPADMELPRRDRALRSALIMRAIAMERGVHSLFFALVAVLALALRVELAGVQGWVRRLLTQLTTNSSGTGNAFGGSFLVTEGNHLLTLKPSTLTIVIAAAVAYCVVEGIEAVGLWLERRWAEYLTVVATAGLVPYEVYELAKSVSVLKVGALVLNLVVLAYLLWSKELFGVGRLRRRGSVAPADPYAPFVRPSD